MVQYLPTDEFEWLDASLKEDWTNFILKQKDEQGEGYFLQVNLEYPEDLHDLHDTYPCAPERFKIDEKYLSEYQKKLGKECVAKFGCEKLCLT